MRAYARTATCQIARPSCIGHPPYPDQSLHRRIRFRNTAQEWSPQSDTRRKKVPTAYLPTNHQRSQGTASLRLMQRSTKYIKHQTHDARRAGPCGSSETRCTVPIKAQVPPLVHPQRNAGGAKNGHVLRRSKCSVRQPAYYRQYDSRLRQPCTISPVPRALTCKRSALRTRKVAATFQRLPHRHNPRTAPC